jgi:predicted transcriptional regulator
LRGLGLEEGSTVYWVRGGRVHTGTIEEICLGNEDEECDLKVHDKEKTNDPTGLNLIRFSLGDFGREIFFSKEQAEEVMSKPR